MPPAQTLSLPYLTRDMLAFENAITFKLRVDIQSDTVATLALRGLTREATFEYKAIASSDSAIHSSEYALSDIPIYVTIEDSAHVLAQGACFVAISLLANGVVIQQLTSGYIYAQKALSWPNTQQVDIRPSGGKLVTIIGSDPAAGVSAEIIVPANQYWIIKTAAITFTTAAVAATRRVYMEVTPNGATVISAISSLTQLISDVKHYTFANYGADVGAVANFDSQVNMPSGLWVDSGGTIDFKAENMNAADNFGAPILTVEQYFTTP